MPGFTHNAITKEAYVERAAARRAHLAEQARHVLASTSFPLPDALPSPLDIPKDDPYLTDVFNVVRRQVALVAELDDIERRVPILPGGKPYKLSRKPPKAPPAGNTHIHSDDEKALALTAYVLLLKTPRVVRPPHWPKTVRELSEHTGVGLTALRAWSVRYRLDSLLEAIPALVPAGELHEELGGALAEKALAQLGEQGKDANPQWFEVLRKWYAIGDRSGTRVQIQNNVQVGVPQWTEAELAEEKRRMRDVTAEVSDG